MTISEALQWGVGQLKKAGVETPALDAEVLLAHAFRKDRAWLYGHSLEHCNTVTLRNFKKLVARRVKREPVAYITGHKEFYGLDFLVNRQVLVPRPETEVLVEEAIREVVSSQESGRQSMVVDVGTGSGAIAVACQYVGRGLVPRRGGGQAPTLQEDIQFFATDISRAALRVAKQNARRHGVGERITFLKGNLLEQVFTRSAILKHGEHYVAAGLVPARATTRAAALRDAKASHYTELTCSARIYPRPSDPQASHYIIVANLPYLPTAEWRATAPEVRTFEPRRALDGGHDGLKYYREMFGQITNLVSLALSPPVPSMGVGGVTVKPHRYEQRNRHRTTIARMTILCELCPEQFPAFVKMVYSFFPKIKCGRKPAAVDNLPHEKKETNALNLSSGKKLTIVNNLPGVRNGVIEKKLSSAEIETVKDLSGRKRVAVVRIGHVAGSREHENHP